MVASSENTTRGGHPLDLMQPYRLEMGLKLSTNKGKNLYQFWGEEITDALNILLETQEEPVLINLASNEYFKSVQKKRLDGRLITPEFKDWKNGKYKMISFFAKKARGLMVRYAIDHNIQKAELLQLLLRALASPGISNGLQIPSPSGNLS